MAKKKVIRIKRPMVGRSSYVTDKITDAVAELEIAFEYDEPGDTLLFEIEDMEEEALAALPEFQGW